MPYTNDATQLTYQREWIAARKAAYLANRRCEHCKRPSDRLSFLAQDGKTFNRNCWSWEPHRRNMELLQAWVLCPKCRRSTLAERRHRRNPLPHGSNRGYDRGCRCAACRRAHALYNREGKLRRKLHAK